MIHLDTHVVIWLVGGQATRLSERARELVSTSAVGVSPMVELELALLHEIGRITAGPADVLGELRRALGLVVDTDEFALAVGRAATPRYAFTRDPFDRVIAAHADTAGTELVTCDRLLRDNCEFAVWD